MDAAIKPDYQIFELEEGVPTNIGPRMVQKMNALKSVLPENLKGKTVLDVGCDFGFWSFLCSSRGASEVLGLDRGREVKGYGYVNLPDFNNSRADGTVCSFEKINLGKSWYEYGKYDLVLLMSLYHHIYNQSENHLSIWYWLSRHVDGELIWENPTDSNDSVVRMNVSGHLHPKYNKKEILSAAETYFDAEYIGPAEHEPTRVVYRFTPKKRKLVSISGVPKSGAGGASKAFVHNYNQRINEINEVLGIECYPGSLNVLLDENFDWDKGYYRAKISDVANRKDGIDSEWRLRWARFYPVLVDGIRCFVFRFENESYPLNFVEIISDRRLRDTIGNYVNVSRYT